MGIYCSTSSLHIKLSAWWMARIKSPCHKAILSLIPSCICWELWNHRNKGKFENIRLLSFHLIRKVESNVQMLLQNHPILSKRRPGDDGMLQAFGVCVSDLPRRKLFLTK